MSAYGVSVSSFGIDLSIMMRAIVLMCFHGLSGACDAVRVSNGYR